MQACCDSLGSSQFASLRDQSHQKPAGRVCRAFCVAVVVVVVNVCRLESEPVWRASLPDSAFVVYTVCTGAVQPFIAVDSSLLASQPAGRSASRAKYNKARQPSNELSDDSSHDGLSIIPIDAIDICAALSKQTAVALTAPVQAKGPLSVPFEWAARMSGLFIGPGYF